MDYEIDNKKIDTEEFIIDFIIINQYYVNRLNEFIEDYKNQSEEN